MEAAIIAGLFNIGGILLTYLLTKKDTLKKLDKKMDVYLYWTRRPSRSYAKAGMNRPAGVKTAHSCGHTSS